MLHSSFTWSETNPEENSSFTDKLIDSLFADSKVHKKNSTPESTGITGHEKSELEIRSNVSGAKVYLNRFYQGTAPVLLRNLTPGSYELKVEAPGYESEKFRIKIEKGKSFSYYVTLEKRMGIVSFRNTTGAEIWCDGNRIENSAFQKGNLLLEEGKHFFRLRKFGYEDSTGELFIRGNFIYEIGAEWKECPFSASDFTLSREVLNPEYSGVYGEVEAAWKVTAPGKALISISDESGNLVFETETETFKDWNQSFVWNGKDSGGNPYSDGKYVIKLSSGGYEFSGSFKIDSSLEYPLTSFGKAGCGFFESPLPLMNECGSVFFGIEGGGIFNGNSGEGIPFDFSLCVTPVEEVELSGGFRAFSKGSGMSYGCSFAVKTAYEKKLQDSGNDFLYGLSVSYGYQDEILFSGFDSGSGLSITGMTGVKNEKFFAGFNSAFTFGAENGDLKYKNSLWKNSLIMRYRPEKLLSLNLSSGLLSFFDESGNDFVHGIENAAGLDYMLSFKPVILNLSGFTHIVFDEKFFYGFKISVSYEF